MDKGRRCEEAGEKADVGMRLRESTKYPPEYGFLACLCDNEECE